MKKVVAASWTRKKVILNNGKSMHKGVERGKYCYCTYTVSEMNDVLGSEKVRDTKKGLSKKPVKRDVFINPSRDIVKNKLEDR